MMTNDSKLLAQHYAVCDFLELFQGEYWQYYDEDYDWDDSKELCQSDPKLTRETLQAAGLSEPEAQQYVESGFVYNKTSKTIIDRL